MSREATEDSRTRTRERGLAWERGQSDQLARREWFKALSVAGASLLVLAIMQVVRASDEPHANAVRDALVAAVVVVGTGTVMGLVALTVLSQFTGIDGGTLRLAIVRMLALSAFFSMIMFFGGSVPLYAAIPAYAFSCAICYWLFDVEMPEAALLTGAAFVLTIITIVAIVVAVDL